jgi:hypothetical protein
MALRLAGVGGDRSIALAAELLDASTEAAAEDARAHASGRRLPNDRAFHSAELDCDWCGPAVVADADSRGHLGDLCGRRVA